MKALSAILPAIAPLLLCAEEAGPLPGHSHVGEAFDEGPRVAAKAIPGTGKVRFPVTTAWDRGQEFFDQGIGQLHGFWYYEAERTFRQIAAEDPDCAMAYWGMAMANWENEKRARQFIEEAVARKENASRREVLYIEARANHLDGEPKDAKRRNQELVNDLENIIHEYPGDHEARAFLVCRLWQLSRKGLPIHSHEAVDALLAQVFADEPLHPAHHYRIHLWDKRKAARALDSAAKLGHTAPAIAHMWHMPGHIYSQLKRFDDSAWAQQASARIDHQHMIEHRLIPDQIFNYAHNNEWLVRNHINIGDAPRALAMAKSLIANPRHPKFNTFQKGSARFGMLRLIDVLEKFELWEEALELGRTAWLAPEGPPDLRAKRLRLLGLAHAGRGDPDGLAGVINGVEPLLAAAEKDRGKAENNAKKKAAGEKKKPKEIEAAVKVAVKKPDAAIKTIRAVREELNLHRALLDGDLEKAGELAGKATGETYAKARLQLRLGNEEKALQMSRDAVEKKPGETLPLAARIEVLQAAGKREEARKAFEKLRLISAHLDPGAPPFLRIVPVAQRCGFDGDWTGTPVTRDDVGSRPDLESLGPEAWIPPAAPGFELPGGDSQSVSLADYRGKPLILIFYLGYGCLHCTEQLDAFAGASGEFEEAGFRILAVSTDSVADLHRAEEGYAEEGQPFPFELVADPGLEVFRRYHAFDDFENQPIHGTFVVDPAGRILWLDLGADPFADTRFVLDEARRLMNLHGSN